MKEDGRVLRWRSGSICAVLQDGSDGLVGAGVEQKGTSTSGIDALCAIALHEPENPDGRAEALFGMRPRTQDDVDQSIDVWPDFGGLAANALMCPVAIAPMGARHMLGDGRRTMRQDAAQMRCHTLTTQENLDGFLGDPRIDLLAQKVVGNTVVMFGNLDVIIEIDPTALPLGILVGLIGQWRERRTIEFVEQFAPTSPP